MRDVRGVAVCTSCGGAFVSCAASDTVQRAFDPHAQSMAELAAQHARGPAVVDKNARAACPSCGAAMARFRVGPVEVDTCFVHGSWYDRGELAQVRDALAAGAQTAEVDVGGPAPPAAAAAAPAVAPLELARPLKKSPLSTPRPASEIDPGAQAAIANLIKHEHAAIRRARSHRRRHGYDHSALEIVEDILDLLD